jgi:hypothetical protein
VAAAVTNFRVAPERCICARIGHSTIPALTAVTPVTAEVLPLRVLSPGAKLVDRGPLFGPLLSGGGTRWRGRGEEGCIHPYVHKRCFWFTDGDDARREVPSSGIECLGRAAHIEVARDGAIVTAESGQHYDVDLLYSPWLRGAFRLGHGLGRALFTNRHSPCQ